MRLFKGWIGIVRCGWFVGMRHGARVLVEGARCGAISAAVRRYAVSWRSIKRLAASEYRACCRRAEPLASRCGPIRSFPMQLRRRRSAWRRASRHRGWRRACDRCASTRNFVEAHELRGPNVRRILGRLLRARLARSLFDVRGEMRTDMIIDRSRMLVPATTEQASKGADKARPKILPIWIASSRTRPSKSPTSPCGKAS